MRESLHHKYNITSQARLGDLTVTARHLLASHHNKKFLRSVKYHILTWPDLTWPSVQTVDEQYLRSGGPVRASPRSPQGGGGPSSLPSRAGKRKSRDTDSKGSMVSQSARQAVLLINYLFRLSKRQARQRDARDQKLARPTRMASIGKFYWELFFISNMFFGKLTKLIECIVCKLSNKPTTIWFFIEFLNFLKTIFMKYII